jgi:hypothetical protein
MAQVPKTDVCTVPAFNRDSCVPDGIAIDVDACVIHHDASPTCPVDLDVREA